MKVILAIIALALLVGGILYYKDKGLLASKESMENIPLVNILGQPPDLPKGERAPQLQGIADWINTKPLAPEELRGKVVLVDFWTYSCINCIRTLPHLVEWHRKYKDNGFVLLGVHTPEFAFEKKKENVLAAVNKHQIEYPVALDNDYATWNAYANRYWPAHYLIDKDGYIRYRTFGEGHYAETESAIQQLLLEAGLLSLDKISAVTEPPPTADFKNIATPEIYLGYSRINNVGNMDQGIKPGEPYTFAEPKAIEDATQTRKSFGADERAPAIEDATQTRKSFGADERAPAIEDNRFYFVGPWKIEPEYAESADPSPVIASEPAGRARQSRSKLVIRYKASKLNTVLDAPNAPVTLELKLDGAPLTENQKGADVIIKDDGATATIDSARLYNLTATNDSDWHTLEIIVPSPGLRAFTFTFG